MTLIELYQSQRQGADGRNGKNSRALLAQTHWFMVNANFDPKTGEALPQALSALLAKVARTATDGTCHDRLWRITEHSRPSVERLFRALNESPRREHALLPVHAVRELDANSFIKLSNRPGRNIREKLAGKPYLQAVRRFQSSNLPENRLLKAFVTRLAGLLELRRDCLGEEKDELLPKIQSWLLSDGAQAIARWDNLPPNNTLLSHRDYRRVWDAWRWLQTLDGDVARDLSQLEVRDQTMRRWNKYGQMYSEGTYHFAEMPVYFDYEKFEIRAWLSQLAFQKATRKIIRSFSTKEISKPVCLDLAFLRPCYATTTDSSVALPEAYLWQQWKNDDESVDIELFNSDAAYLHADATSISSADLFFSKNNIDEHLECAARAFASRLSETFKNDTLIWLVPDFLNDFELENTRRNINARFPNAEPLPRSVAAVFEQVDYSKIKRDGFTVVVVETIGNTTCVTKLIARSHLELKRRLPETNGFYWERCPPVIISHSDMECAKGKEWQNYDIITVDDKGQWRDRIRTTKPQFIDSTTLKRDPRIGSFAFCINLIESPVVGGIRLHALQQRAGDIPLWLDHLPELSMLIQRFRLVDKDIPNLPRPIRGQPVQIPVHEEFELEPGRQFYSFPLYQGENAVEIGYSACLYSSAFPLKAPVSCKLNLTFEYGVDEPYKLIFEPPYKSFPPIRAIWRRTEEIIITDAPSPKYPTPMYWADLRKALKPDGKETRDLLDWVVSAVDRLDSDLFIRPQKRTLGKIIRHWGVDKNGNHFTKAKCEDIDTEVFIHENSLIDGLGYEELEVGDEVSFELEKSKGRFSACKTAKRDYKETSRLRNLDDDETKELIKNIHKRLYVPFIHVWRDGRSTTDKECPKDFANSARKIVSYLTDLLSQPEIPQPVKNELLFLLACIHKDTTDDCVRWITEQVKNGNIRAPRAIGFALGDVSTEWQLDIFRRLAAKPTPSTISVFAYAIWRQQCFIERFTIQELQANLEALLELVARLQPFKRKFNPNDVQNNDQLIIDARPLELLLGLLRARASINEDIRMLLQPHQIITKRLAKEVERVTKTVVQSNVDLYSRIQLDIQKPEDDHTPDLLYALRQSLAGEGIRVRSVSDD